MDRGRIIAIAGANLVGTALIKSVIEKSADVIVYSKDEAQESKAEIMEPVAFKIRNGEDFNIPDSTPPVQKPNAIYIPKRKKFKRR